MAVEKAEIELTLNDKPFTSSMNKARQSTQGLTTGINKAGASIGAAATSVSGLNTAMGGSVGTTNNLIGAAGNLATTFAAAGPLGLAIAAASVGIGLLADKWGEAGRAAEKAAEDSKKAAEKMAGDLLRLDVQLSALKAGISTTLVGAADDANRLGAELEEVKQKLFEAGFGGLKATLPLSFTGTDPLSLKLKGYSEDFVRLKGEVEDATKVVTKMIEIEGFVAGTGSGGGAGGAPPRGRGRTGKGAGAEPLDPFAEGPQINAYVLANREGQAKVEADRAAHIKFISDLHHKAQREDQIAASEALKRSFEDRDQQTADAIASNLSLYATEAEERIRLEEMVSAAKRESADEAAQLAMGVLAATASMAEQVGRMLVDSHENMALAMLNLVAQQVGGFIIGEGVKLGGVAVAKFFSGDFGGAALAAGGSALLISAGVGIKVGGYAAMQSGIPGAGGGGGGSGGAAASSGASSSGGAGFSGGSAPSGDGGGLTVNVNYGVGGMNREDVARGVASAMREANARGF